MPDKNYAYTSRAGALWIFPEGPNREGEYMGCVDADDISQPEGDVSLIQCFDPNGDFKVVGELTSPPDPVTTVLTQLTNRTRTWLERIKNSYGLIFLQRDGGRADHFNNWKRALILQDVNNTSKTYGGVLSRETDTPTTRGFSISAVPPVIQVQPIRGSRKTVTTLFSAYNVAMLNQKWGVYPARYGLMGLIAFGGVKADVLITQDGGHSWTPAATQPFAINEAILNTAIFDMGNGIIRFLVIKQCSGVPTQSEAAYSEDFGFSWTVVPIGGPADDTEYGPEAIYYSDSQHIWLGDGNSGIIWYSGDGGETWVKQEDNIAYLNPYTKIGFSPNLEVGYAGTDSGEIAKTVNGGLSWFPVSSLPDAPSGIYGLTALDENKVWALTDLGLFYSEDGGLTWAQRTGFANPLWEGFDMRWVNEWVGFMLRAEFTGPNYTNGALYRTIDGGYTWDVLPCDVISGFAPFAIHPCDENYCVMVGDPDIGPGLTTWVSLFEE